MHENAAKFATSPTLDGADSSPDGGSYVCPRCWTQTSNRLGARCPVHGCMLVSSEDLASRGHDPLLGAELGGGKYAVVGVLGSGGMGLVYRAIQLSVDREVALKVMTGSGAATPQRRVRFDREARAIAALQHENVVTLFDYGHEPNGLLFLVMERVHGWTLRRVLAERGPLPTPEAAEIATQMLSALGEAHARGIVHRDLKPDNVVLVPTRDGRPRVKVLDFGLARMMHEASDATREGDALGTPQYMAPEQARGEESGPTVDLYATGVVLFELLTGRPPFEAEMPMGVMWHHSNSPAPHLPSTHSAALNAVVQRALAKSPSTRFGSAEEMARALADAVAIEVGGSSPWVCEPTAPAEPPHPPERSLRRPAFLGAALFLAGLGAAAVAWTPAGRPAERAAPVDDTATVPASSPPPASPSASSASADVVSGSARGRSPGPPTGAAPAPSAAAATTPASGAPRAAAAPASARPAGRRPAPPSTTYRLREF